MLFRSIFVIFLILGPLIYFAILVSLLKKDLKDSLFQVFLFFVLTVIFLNKLLFKHQPLAQQDFNNIQIPLFHFYNQSILKFFSPPIWNSSFCGGFDAFSNPLAAYFSIFNWIFLLSSNVYRNFSFFIFCSRRLQGFSHP